MTHKHMEKYGKKVIEKFLTERQIRMLRDRKNVWFQVDKVLIILKPKAKNQKLLNRILKYKQKIKEMESKIK